MKKLVGVLVVVALIGIAGVIFWFAHPITRILGNAGTMILSKIASLSSEEIAQNINKLNDSHTDTESYIENMALAMIDLDETTVLFLGIGSGGSGQTIGHVRTLRERVAERLFT